jgi:putative acetyltransferase
VTRARCATRTCAIRELCAADYTPEQIEAWTYPKKPEHYVSPITNGQVFVAEIDGRLVGFSEFSEDEIRAVYVHPKFARKGIGSALFRRVAEELMLRGVVKAWLHASLTSVPFYSAMGCRAGEKLSHLLSSGMEIPCVLMTIEFRNEAVRE